MKADKKTSPPRWATKILSWYCKASLLEDLEGDLHEYFERNVATRGVRAARWIYILDVLKFIRPYTIKRPKFFNLFIHWIMIGSYLKTSGRSIVRNRMFSAINIFGLAVSMTVGLLLMAMISDLLSYDSFHANKDRIYRVNTKDEMTGRDMDLASASALAGKKIRETFSGVEAVTLMRRGFGGDLAAGEITVPVDGLWADGAFFDVFSFPFIEGNAATALKEPYSLVLTEKSSTKIFGSVDVVGKSVKVDGSDYTITGVLQNIPSRSHLQFETLASFSTVELTKPDVDGDFYSWENIYMNYIYVLLPESNDALTTQSNLNNLSAAENAGLENRKISLWLQPLHDIPFRGNLANELGGVFHSIVLWILGGLGLIVILSACFNYTNLSIARAFRRSREVGVRKVIGATKGNVITQFITESVIVSLLALAFSFLLFLALRPQFLFLHPFLTSRFSLELTPTLILSFIGLALIVGIISGFLPALFFSRIQASKVLKDVSSMKVFRHVNMRKALIVIQYTFSLIFITTTIIGYRQYQSLISHDLGFDTENIVNIDLKQSNGKAFIDALSEVPEVQGVSRSTLVISLGSKYSQWVRCRTDSGNVMVNMVDENYLSLHNYKFLSGRNFLHRDDSVKENEVIVNEEFLKRYDIASRDPQKAVGEEVVIDNHKMMIVGVVKDFHYGTLIDEIHPTLFRNAASFNYGYANVKVQTADWPATFTKIEKVWKQIDPVHPLSARFYDEQIEEAYSQFSIMVKVIGFIAFITVCIASLGLLGMVVFTTETRLKEISIRKVLGATEVGLVFMLSRGFLVLLTFSTVIALPITYIFFRKVVLSHIVFHKPISVMELVSSVLVVMVIAMILIGSQTLRAARQQPAETLNT